jgi:hypothetical protein
MFHVASSWSIYCPLKYQNIGKWTGTRSVVILILWGLRGRDRTHHDNRKSEENPFLSVP